LTYIWLIGIVIATLFTLVDALFTVTSLQTPCEDPIKCIYTYTGYFALYTLFSLLFLRFSQSHQWISTGFTLRKLLGWLLLFYVFLHFLNFVLLDSEMQSKAIVAALIKHPFILFGFIAFILLAVLGLLSAINYNRFKQWFILFDVAVIGIAIHIAMSQKVVDKVIFIYLLILVATVMEKYILKKV